MNLLKYAIVFLTLFLTQQSYSQWVEEGCGYDNQNGVIFGVSVPQSGVVWGVVEEDGFDNFQTKTAVTIDDGVTWNIYDIDTLNTFTCIKIKAIDDITAFASTLTFPEEDSTRIYRTQDSGVSWQLIPSAFNGPYEACIDFHFFDDINGVAFGAPISGPLTIYTTSDGGSNWVKVQAENLPIPDPNEGMVITTGNGSYGASNDNLWFGTTTGRIYKTSDQGLTWSASTIDENRSVSSVAFKDDLNGIVTSTFSAQATSFLLNKCWTTNDGGNTWIEVENLITNPRMAMCQYIPGSENSFICTSSSSFANGGTMISNDGGLTWEDIDGASLYGAEFISENEGWAGGFTSSTNEGIFRWTGISSIQEISTFRNLIISPTLASNEITISNFNGILPDQIQLININGQAISKRVNSGSIDVSDLKPGLYQIFFNHKRMNFKGRFIKE